MNVLGLVCSSNNSGGLLGGGIVLLLTFVVSIAVMVLYLASIWKMFKKAGEPGWASLVPLYNTYVLWKIARGNGLLMFLVFIPFVGWFFALHALYKLALAFGYGTGFAWLTVFFPQFCLPVIGLSSASYYGPQG